MYTGRYVATSDIVMDVSYASRSPVVVVIDTLYIYTQHEMVLELFCSLCHCMRSHDVCVLL